MRAPLGWLRRGDPSRDALIGDDAVWSAGDLGDEIERVAARLRDDRVRVLATRLDNGIAWAIADLAAWHADVVHLPLPTFFTPQQAAYALAAAGADAVLRMADGDANDAVLLPGTRLQRLDAAAVPMFAGTVKLSFTSGSTGRPKGVCLSGDALADVARGVAEVLSPQGIRRHLSALPLPVLLENVAGLYAPLVAGAAVVLPPLHAVGLTGSSHFDPATLQRAVERHRADSTIVLPQMLRAWAGLRRGDEPAPRFVAVGGAVVGAPTIELARRRGLPAYEGYGLTEAGSVQTLNRPGADRPGSVGRVLPHARVRVGADGGIEVAGTPMLGYLGGAPQPPPAWWPTGDLGRIDDDGFVHLDGRRDNLIVTPFGRNVSPEWVEATLQSQPQIAQAVVLGDRGPALAAVLWPRGRPGEGVAPAAAIDVAVQRANAALPDYARIGRWLVADVPFDAAGGLATDNGRPRRDAIARRYGAALAARPNDEEQAA